MRRYTVTFWQTEVAELRATFGYANRKSTVGFSTRQEAEAEAETLRFHGYAVEIGSFVPNETNATQFLSMTAR